ncbi:hypothetical protein AAZX31_07G020500 [Glycine max]|nr:probable fucosyltransferase 7 isoform X2 [Glycine max]|eukprot:XP_014633147.1 probable fucosyltransferase 7 isoform X2 [Glycine max]
MEIFQATAEKMEINPKRFTTLFFVVLFISFPVAFIVSSIYRNSSFAIFYEGLTESSAQNVTNNGFPLGGRVHNTTSDDEIETHLRTRHNDTVSVVLPGNIQNGSTVEERARTMNSTASGIGKVERGTDRNVTAELLNGGVKDLQERSQNNFATEGRSENITAAYAGSKNASLASSTNVSTTEPVNLDDNDKLLGGLLTSGFDEASCKSRMQSHLYRKASPHKPSPYLISKLRKYEEIHRRCGPNTRDYDKSMKKIVSSKNNGAATKCKYIIWNTANGLGNQMISIAATFLYAILTDRVLLVKFNKDKHGLFCEPFLNSTWILPQKSPFSSWNEHNTETYQTMLDKDRASNSKKGLPSVLFINLQFSFENPEKYFHCDHSQDLLRKIPMLILRSDQYYVPSMFMNPFFNLEIANMFPERDIIFHHLGRYLFHPSNDAWELISSYYQAHLASASERIGLQIRVFNAATTPKQAIMNLVLSCTLQQKILPEVDLKTSVSSAGKNMTTVKAVLVASLHKEYGDNLRSMYLKKPTVSGEVIEVYQPSHEGKQKFNDNGHNLKAWTDMYLLSLSDVLVTTSLSTFGYVAQGLGNLKPWLLYRLVGNHSGDFPRCERDFSTEPCFHMPPKHYCNGEPMNDIVSSFPNLRECKDLRFGVKLAAVNGSM